MSLSCSLLQILQQLAPAAWLAWAPVLDQAQVSDRRHPSAWGEALPAAWPRVAWRTAQARAVVDGDQTSIATGLALGQHVACLPADPLCFCFPVVSHLLKRSQRTVP